MAEFNNFEIRTNGIVNEAASDILNDTQKALKRMTPGSELFNGPGHITIKYESDKNYYPNIRSGFMGLKNLKQDEANNKVIAYIDQLKTIRAWDFRSPDLSKIQNYISNEYSPNYMMDAQEELNAATTAFQTISSAFPTPPSFMQVAQLDAAVVELTQANTKYYNMNNQSGTVDPPENQVPGSKFLRNDGKKVSIYRDKWDVFLNIVQNAVVGAGQERYQSNATTYSIVLGEAPGEHTKEKRVRYQDTKTLSPQILQQFHDKIMVPLFLSGKNNVLIYATTEQWNSISQGGRAYKIATGLAAQAYTAGQNRPKVSL